MNDINPYLLPHIIRDIFKPEHSVICFGDNNTPIINAMRDPEHGIEAWGLTADTESISEFTHPWIFDVNDTFYGFDFCDLFMSFDYGPEVRYGTSLDVALRIARLIRPRGLVFLVNPGKWAGRLGEVLFPRPDLVREVRRYHMFSEENVLVLQR